MVLLARLFLVCTAAPSLVPASFAASTRQQGDPPSLLEFLQAMTRGFAKNDETTQQQQNPPQPILVIGAGLPRTGTSSFVVALNKLGLETYHMRDGAVETPGHLQLWYDYYHNKNISMDTVLDGIAAHGFNATCDAPTCFSYREQMKQYPDAKVVLTVRGDGSGEAWRKSFTSAILDTMWTMRQIPYRWFDMFPTIDSIVVHMLQDLGMDVDPDTGFPVKSQLAHAYNQWVQTVKATVPEEKLLVHAPKDGWKPLCDFLSPLSADIHTNCDLILSSGEAYPHVNDTAKVQALLVALQTISILCKLLPVGVVGALFLKWVSHRGRSKRDERNKIKSQ